MDAPAKLIAVTSMAASNILLLFQSAHVLRTKKTSEETADSIPKPVQILSNTRHLPGVSFGIKLKYRFVARRRKGTYRVTI
jgi:hypothetical protein